MAKADNQTKRWPSSVSEDESLYAVVDDKSGEVRYLVFSSQEKGDTMVRDNGAWASVSDEFFEETIDDPDYYNADVDVDFIDFFDLSDSKGEYAKFSDYSKSEKPVTAAVKSGCPEATQDIVVNLKNRGKAISGAMYGPLNPDEPNNLYWSKLAGEWGVDVETAKQQRCGNCAMFIVTEKMKNCIESGVTGGERADEFDLIDAAGELGYCEAFDFKCASARTCRAWVTGGPISDNIKS